VETRDRTRVREGWRAREILLGVSLHLFVVVVGGVEEKKEEQRGLHPRVPQPRNRGIVFLRRAGTRRKDSYR
jgi:hypothetical protein